MAKLNLSTVIYPKSEIIAVCSICQKEVGRIAYDGYADHSRQKSKLIKQAEECPHCKAVFQEKAKKPDIPWERTASGEYIAKATNGDFLVWKWGNGYKWRYRPYGQPHPDVVRTAKTKDLAQRACERHGEWR